MAFQLRDLQAMQTTSLTLKAMQERIETSSYLQGTVMLKVRTIIL